MAHDRTADHAHRFLRGAGSEPPRLVSIGGIQDFEKLFFHSRAATLDAAFLNLSLILGYKVGALPRVRGRPDL